MAVSLCIVPASASDGISGAVQDFFEWTVNASNQVSNSFWRAIYGDSWNSEWDGGSFGSEGVVGGSRSDALEKLNEYNQTFEEDTGGTGIGESEFFVHYFRYGDSPWFLFDTYNTDGFSAETNLGGYAPMFYYEIVRPSNEYANLTAQLTAAQIETPFTVPYDAEVRYKYNSVASGAATLKGSSDFDLDWHYATANSELKPGTVSIVWTYVDITDSSVRGEAKTWVEFKPRSGAIEDKTTLDIGTDSRAGSIVGDFAYSGQDGETVIYNDCTFFDEATGIYKNPASGSEQVVADWVYDYPTREYDLTFEDGSHGRVVYGDDNATVYEGDVQYVYNYGDGSGSSDDGGGTGIGDAIANLFTVLGEIILGLITALVNLATKALDAFKGLFDLFGQLVETITGFFGGFTDFLAGVFPFLPDETFTIFNFGLILLVAATVFRKFLK